MSASLERWTPRITVHSIIINTYLTVGKLIYGNLIQLDPHYKLSSKTKYENFTLEIRHTEYSDRGDYYCCIQRTNGTEQCKTFTLRVKGIWNTVDKLTESIYYNVSIRLYSPTQTLSDPEHPEVAFVLNNLALLYHQLDRHAEAEPMSRRALAINEKILGPEHPSVASSLNILAIVSSGLGRPGEAEPLHRRALEIYQRALGVDHLRTAWPLHGLANLCRDQGRFVEAEALYRRVLEIRERGLGREHPDTRETVADYARSLSAAGRGEEAEALVARWDP